VKGQGNMPCPFCMVRKLRDSDIIKEAFEELAEEYGHTSSILDKTAFNINIDPASVVGAITGAAVAKRQMNKNMLKQQIEEDNTKVLHGGYYKQVSNIANNLRVIFSPFSVIYVVKNGPHEITLETINTDEMDDDMYSAYQNRDANYFKRLLLNKINSEVQLAEQMFARRMIQKQLELENRLNNSNVKHASADEITFSSLLARMYGVKSVFEKNAESVLGDYFVKSLGDNYCEIEWSFDDIRPLSKYANIFKETLNFFGLNLDKNNIKELQGKMMEPGYLKRKLKVGFLPNRVVYSVDNMVITQLPVMGMNEEGFEAFQNEDISYFKNLFEEELKKKEVTPIFNPMTKVASDANETREVKEIFEKSEIHPKLYEIVLDKAFGRDWIKYDPAVIIKEIEEKFGLENGITDPALNKILVLQLINKSFEPFMNPHVFEKCVRAMNDKPIDFLARETNFGLGELVFALKVIQDTTPADDIYDNFSEAVFAYIADTLTANEYRVALPEPVVNSKTEVEFYKTLNSFITSKWNDIISEGLTDKKKIANIGKENSIISSASIKLISAIRKAGEYNPRTIDDIAKKTLGRLALPKHVRNIILNTVKDNMASDVYLQYKDDLLLYQTKLYNL